MKCAEKGCRRETRHAIVLYVVKGQELKRWNVCPEARDRLEVGIDELLSNAPVRKRKKAANRPKLVTSTNDAGTREE